MYMGAQDLPMQKAGMGIRVRDLNRSYGKQHVLRDVSFEVPAGGVCTLLGASGSGKTTTLRLLAGLDRPDSGVIEIDGKVVASDTVFIPGEHRQIGMVFQSYALWPHMTAFDQIAYPLRLRRTARKALDEAVRSTAAMVGLADLLERYPSELSGGQQQRVALARALVFGPKLLLLDEPMSGLDAALRRRTRYELEELQKRVGITTVYVTHDQEEAMSVSDIVVVMSNGRIESIAPPRGTYDHPKSIYVASFVGASNLLPGKVIAVDNGVATVRLSDGVEISGVAGPLVAVGAHAVCAVKPVDVNIDVAGQTRNVVKGTVKSSTYLGPQVELLIDIAGVEFRVPVPRESGHRAGLTIDVHLPIDRVSILEGSLDSPASAEIARV